VLGGVYPLTFINNEFAVRVVFESRWRRPARPSLHRRQSSPCVETRLRLPRRAKIAGSAEVCQVARFVEKPTCKPRG